MMHAPTPAAIRAAEMRVARSSDDTRESLRRAGSRARTAWRSAAPRVRWTLVAAGALLGIWIARRRRGKVSASPRAAAVATTSTAGILFGSALRYAMQRLPVVLQQLWAARSADAARERATVRADTPKRTTNDDEGVPVVLH